jgi:hypothetical protein
MHSLKLRLLRLQHEGVSRMTTQDFMMTRFCQVDDQMAEVPKRPDAKLCPSQVVPLALLFAIRRWHPCLLSLADTRVSGVVSPCTRADTRVSPVQDLRGVDDTVSGCANGAGDRRQLRDSVHPSDAGRAQPAPDWQKREKSSSVDGGRQAVFCFASVGLGLCLGRRHGERP